MQISVGRPENLIGRPGQLQTVMLTAGVQFLDHYDKRIVLSSDPNFFHRVYSTAYLVLSGASFAGAKTGNIRCPANVLTMGENLRTPGFPRRDERVGVVPVMYVLCWYFFSFFNVLGKIWATR